MSPFVLPYSLWSSWSSLLFSALFPYSFHPTLYSEKFLSFFGSSTEHHILEIANSGISPLCLLSNGNKPLIFLQCLLHCNQKGMEINPLFNPNHQSDLISLPQLFEWNVKCIEKSQSSLKFKNLTTIIKLKIHRVFKGALSGLRQVLATESRLKMIKNAFHSL